jgi:hypothetical protein
MLSENGKNAAVKAKKPTATRMKIISIKLTLLCVVSYFIPLSCICRVYRYNVLAYRFRIDDDYSWCGNINKFLHFHPIRE